MSTGTELVEITSDAIELQAEQDRKSQTTVLQGRLVRGENIDGYTIIGLFNTSGGEAELYFCEKQGIRYVFKYYNGPVREEVCEILDKLKPLQHPNILSHLDYGKYKGYFYTILEFAEGSTVSDKSGNAWKFLPLSEEKAEEAINEIIEGFKAIHSKGIIHRDIKPENLFYRSIDNGLGNGILIGDFGIASLFQSDQGMTSHYTEHDFATDGYEAPEMYAVGKDADSGELTRRISPAIDYYALGITIWVLLTGKEPFVDEKGNGLWPGQIRRNATNRQTADILIKRAPNLSEKMKKLIRGLLVTRHKERWDYDKIKAHFAGEDVEVFYETLRDMPPFDIDGKNCRSFIEISRTLIANPEVGMKLVFSGKLTDYMFSLMGLDAIDQADAEKIADMVDDYSSKQKENEGLYAVAYSLTPNLPFIVGRYKDNDGKEKDAEVRTVADIQNFLVTEPDLLIPFLKNPAKGFYSYLDVQGRGDIGEKVWKVVDSSGSDLKIIPRLQIAFMDNIIEPFKEDEKNKDRKLKTIEQLEELPKHLQERLLVFIEMKRDDITAWIENISGKNLDAWLSKYKYQKDKLTAWGLWKSFCLFLEGKDVQSHKTFSVGEGAQKRWGLKNIFGDEILAPAWEFVLANSPPDRFIVKKNGKWGVVESSGQEIICTKWKLLMIFDEERCFYLCKDDDDAWHIVDEKENILWNGKEALKVAFAPGKPFDVVYDSVYYYNHDTFEALNKEGVTFAIAKSKDANYVWQTANDGCLVCNGNGESLASLPYTGFRVPENGIGVMVEKSGSWGIALADGSTEIIPCSYVDIRNGGVYYALFMPGKTGGILCEIVITPSGDYKQKNRYWLKFAQSGEVEILPAGGGDVIAAFKSVAHLGLDYTGTEDFAPAKKLACLSDGELVWFDIAAGTTNKRNTVSKGEAHVILDHCSGAELYVLLQFLKEQAAYKGMNQLIDAAAEMEKQAKNSWAMQKSDGHWLKILNLLDPNHSDGLSHSYDVYLFWMGMEALKDKNYQDAYTYYSRAITLKPNNAVYLAGCGAVYFSLGDYNNSAEYFNKAIVFTTVKSLSAQYLAARGSAFFSANKFNEAIAAFAQAISELDTQTPAEFFNARAACYRELNLGDKAWSDIELAAKAPQISGEKIRGVPLPVPRDSSVNINEAAQSGNIQIILKAMNALKAEGAIIAMNALVDASFQQFRDRGEFGEAIQILKKINPQSAQGLRQPVSWYLNQTGLCYYNMKNYSEALPYFLDASKQSPNDPNILFNCGNTCYNLKNFRTAEEQFKQSTSLGHEPAKEMLNRMKREQRI